MSQYGPDSKEEQPQGCYSPPQSHPKGHYPPEQPSYGPPPYNQQAYPPRCEQRAPGNPGYDQGYDQSMNAHQQQYQPNGENASYYSNREQLLDLNDLNGPEGEKGLGSTVVGGAAGGYMGHKMGGGWGTAAGVALGAVGMNMVSHKMKQTQAAAPVQQVPVQQPPVQQVVAVPGIRGRIAQRRLGRRGLIGL